jgi:hypothetical protein
MKGHSHVYCRKQHLADPRRLAAVLIDLAELIGSDK